MLPPLCPRKWKHDNNSLDLAHHHRLPQLPVWLPESAQFSEMVPLYTLLPRHVPFTWQNRNFQSLIFRIRFRRLFYLRWWSTKRKSQWMASKNIWVVPNMTSQTDSLTANVNLFCCCCLNLSKSGSWDFWVYCSYERSITWVREAIAIDVNKSGI